MSVNYVDKSTGDLIRVAGAGGGGKHITLTKEEYNELVLNDNIDPEAIYFVTDEGAEKDMFIQTGMSGVIPCEPGSYVDYEVTFPNAFEYIPVVTITNQASGVSYTNYAEENHYIYTVSTTGFTIRVTCGKDAQGAVNPNFYWIAVAKAGTEVTETQIVSESEVEVSLGNFGYNYTDSDNNTTYMDLAPYAHCVCIDNGTHKRVTLDINRHSNLYFTVGWTILGTIPEEYKPSATYYASDSNASGIRGPVLISREADLMGDLSVDSTGRVRVYVPSHELTYNVGLMGSITYVCD